MWTNIPDGWEDMSEDERKDAAYAKGQQDFAACGGQVDGNPITDAICSYYDPPDGYQEKYADTWNNAKSQA